MGGPSGADWAVLGLASPARARTNVRLQTRANMIVSPFCVTIAEIQERTSMVLDQVCATMTVAIAPDGQIMRPGEAWPMWARFEADAHTASFPFNLVASPPPTVGRSTRKDRP